MPDEAPNANASQAIGKVRKFVVGTDWESYTGRPLRSERVNYNVEEVAINFHDITKSQKNDFMILSYL